MSHPGDSDLDDGADVRTALAALLENEPDLPSGSTDIERRGRRRLVARRLGGGVAAAVVLAAGLTAVSLAARGPAGPTQVAQSPVATASPGPVNTDRVLAAVARALPDGFSVDDVPIVDGVGGGQGVEIEIQLTRQDDERTWLLTVRVAENGCTATVEPTAFSDADLEAIADAYCGAREDNE